MSNPMKDILIGTMAGKGAETPAYLKQLLPLGFECFQINFWKTLGGVDLARLADEVNQTLDGSGVVISSLGVYGNPMETTEEDRDCFEGWKKAIEAAPLFGTDLVAGFSGRVRGKSIPDNMDRYKKVWGELGDLAANKGVRIAFENCPMGGNWQSGDWNIAINPDAWELMFEALPHANIGLEWEPCHQMGQLIDPMPQLRHWVDRIFHIHGKDATILHDVIRTHGTSGKETYFRHRTPGFGDSNWTDIISMLRLGGFKGAIDIEGWHDPVYRDELEMTGQVHGLNYLKQCRGGEYIPL